MTDEDYTMEVMQFLKEQHTKPKKPHKAPYKKPDSVKVLEDEWYAYKQRQHPSNPAVIKNKLRDDTANGITECVMTWLKLHGCFAARVNTTGIYSVKLGRYIRGGSTKGMADVSAVVNGRSVQVEVKAGRDKPRPEQLKVKQQVEAAGGVYLFVHSLDDFLTQIKTIL